MIMKYNKFFAAILTVTLFGSCSDFLTELPTTSPSELTIYNSEPGLEAAILGCYQSMQTGNGCWQRNMSEFLQPASGLVCWKGSRTTEDWTQTMRFTMLPLNARNTELFEHFYASINCANTIIERLLTSSVEESYKNEIEGEARLIRAINYFTLVRLYGDVPIKTVPSKNLDEANHSPRESYMKVYELIIDDLKFAETWMRDEARQAQVAGTVGRPNKWAATSFKAAVYAQIACLIENKEYMFFDLNKEGRAPDFTALGIQTAKDAWELSLQASSSVITDGPYELESSYADLFAWKIGSPVYQSKERVFVLNCTNNTSFSFLTTRTMPQWVAGTLNTTTNNSNWGRIRPSRWLLTKWGEVHGGVKWTGRKDKLTNLYKSCPDPRYDISFFHTSYKKQQNGKESTASIWPKDNNANSFCNNNWYLPFYKKYLDPHWDVTNGYADFYLMRYAEVILYAAEAAASLSSSVGDENWQKAEGYLEMIYARARHSVAAGKADAKYPNVSDWGNLTTSQELVNAIMWERMFELAGENHEFYDTHRRGAKWLSEFIAKPLNAFNALPEQNYKSKDTDKTFFAQHYGEYVFEEDYQKLRKAVVLAYPDKDIRNNTALTEADVNDFYYNSLNE